MNSNKIGNCCKCTKEILAGESYWFLKEKIYCENCGMLYQGEMK